MAQDVLVIICSWSLQQRLVSDTGRYFDALNLSPFLKVGETLADFQSSGSSPRSMVLWNSVVRIGEISSAMSRSILAGIISGPQALLGLIFFRSFSTPSLVTVISGMDG